MIGTTLDKYEVLQKVGEGGMATVYRGRHVTLHRDVAIKVLHPHLSSSTRNRKRFAREARAIEHLRHDNILEIFDYSGAQAEECYIVTEFVEGETLTSVLDRTGTIPSEVAAIIGIHLARALCYAHEAGVLHRDLKPDNVMVRDDGTLKLMDFGIARFLDESQVTMTGALVGSPAFMSPEQAGEATLDPRSDLFSLGTLLFLLVTGHLPFAGSNPSLILKNIIEGNRPSVVELAPTASASLADVIERLLQRDREERYPSAREVETALRACLEETEVDPSRPPWALKAWLADPEAYLRRLDEHLKHVLLEKGREWLAAGDHLAALRLFNRLLSMDDDNPEVMALVQGLHGQTQRRRAVAPVAGLAVGLALAAVLTVWVLRPANEPLETVEDPPEPAAAIEQPIESPEPVLLDEPDPPTEGPDDTDAEPSPEPPPPSPPRAVTRAVLPPLTRPEPPPLDDRPGSLEVVVQNPQLVGQIVIDGEVRGNTRPPNNRIAELTPGEHEVILRGDLIEDQVLRATVGPGERARLSAALTPRPIAVAFGARCPSSCNVALNGAPQGTLDTLGGILVVDQPDRPNHLALSCEDGYSHEVELRPHPPQVEAGGTGLPRLALDCPAPP